LISAAPGAGSRTSLRSSRDYDGGEDLEVRKRRQAALNAADARAGNTYRPLVVDGIVGPASLAAARRLRFARWRDVG
jgi:hypothetical protein